MLRIGWNPVSPPSAPAPGLYPRNVFAVPSIIHGATIPGPGTPATTNAVAGAVAAADFLKADLIVVATVTGRTALALSRMRGKVPIIAFTDREEVSRRMCLYWGVTPQLNRSVAQSPDSLLKHVIAWGRRNGILESGSRVILVGHAAWLGETHDLMMVHVVP